MSSQQNSLTTSPYSSSSSPIDFDSNALEEPLLLHRTSTAEQPESPPEWEDASQANPWVLPKRDTHFNPLSSTRSNYFSNHYNRSQGWHSLGSSPAESLTSTGFAAGHMLVNSVQSPISNTASNGDGSSDLLTPPAITEYPDLPPYKPRTPDSSSLTMSKVSRTRSISFGKDARKKRCRAYSNRSRRFREKDFKVHSAWWHGTCQVAQRGDGYNHIYQRHNNLPLGNSDQCSSSFPSFDSSRTSTFTVVQPLIRRWSCIEVRGHAQVDSRVPCKTAPLAGPTSFMDHLVSKYLEIQRRNSASSTAGTKHKDIIQRIRKTLTTNKIPSPEVPDLITLRRATVSKRPRTREDDGVVSTEISPSPSDSHSDEEETPESYIITKSDINAITNLIKAAFNEDWYSSDKPSTPASHMPRAPTFTKKGLDLGAGSIVESTVSSAEVQLCLSDGNEPPNFLHVVSETTVVAPALSSKKSMHEVIWEGDISSTPIEAMSPSKSTGSFENIEEDVIAPEHDFPTPMTLRIPEPVHYFDPNCLSPERNHWPFKSPRDEIDFVFPSSESTEHLAVPLSSATVDASSKLEATSTRVPPPRPALKSHVASMKVPQIERPTLSPIEWSRKDSLQDVLSFPPLPTRSSNDWYSPLPLVDFGTEASSYMNSRSLYDIGLDVNCGPPTTVPTNRVLTPEQSRTSWIRTAESSAKDSRVPSLAFDPGYEVCQKSLKYTHTVIPVIEETFAVEEALVMSNSAPLMSDFFSEVTQGIKRVKTIDNIHKGERPGHWSPYRPPSVYPTSITPSPSERSTDEDRQLSLKPGKKLSNLKASIDSLDLLQNVSPPSPGTPWPVEEGIEKQLGHLASRGSIARGACPAHVCDECEMDPRFRA